MPVNHARLRNTLSHITNFFFVVMVTFLLRDVKLPRQWYFGARRTRPCDQAYSCLDLLYFDPSGQTHRIKPREVSRHTPPVKASTHISLIVTPLQDFRCRT